jgi:hypothetical protein
MALIYLRHARHGVKIATLEMEAEADEENGWERFDPNDDDSGRSDQRSVETVGRPRRRRNAFSRDIAGRVDSPESDDRLVEY